MIQEIITYMIIGSAITLAALKIFKKLTPGKKAVAISKGSVKSVHEHNCSDCSAECQLRDLPKQIIQKNIEECVQVEQKSKSLQT